MSPRPQKPEPPAPKAVDLNAIALVLQMRHFRHGKTRKVFACKCETCRAINHVITLARRAVKADVAERRVAGGWT